jgi:coenzyme F420 hydrogenase subunit beta
LSAKVKIFGHLLKEVVRENLCVGCGACVAICPVDALTLEDGVPKLVGKCSACGNCYSACPRTDFDEAKMEEKVFGRARSAEEADLGIVRKVYAVRALKQNIRERCQDGGAVTAVLAQFLDEGGESAIVAGLDKDKPWTPVPVAASTEKEIVENAGTKYTSSPTILGVRNAVKKNGKKKIAVVGTPCQVRALRRVEFLEQKQEGLPKAEYLDIGLFCMETLSQDGLLNYLRSEGIDPSKVTKFEIKSGKFIAHRVGEPPYEVKLKRVKHLVRTCCHVCKDFTSEFSDLSVGNVGSPDGWSTVLVRTEKGEKALKVAEKAGLVEVQPLEEGEKGIGFVVRLAKIKREAATKGTSDQ